MEWRNLLVWRVGLGIEEGEEVEQEEYGFWLWLWPFGWFYRFSFLVNSPLSLDFDARGWERVRGYFRY